MEYDADERDSWYALDELEAATCPHCGQLRSVCGDPTVAWYPQRTVCWATAAREVARRRFTELHKDAKPDAAGFQPGDGLFAWVSTEDLSPDDNWLGDPV